MSDKSATSVQLVPSNASVIAKMPVPEPSPPFTSKEVPLPVQTKEYLAVFKSATSVHNEPFHNSVVSSAASGHLQ